MKDRTRRDFVVGTALGAGAAFSQNPAANQVRLGVVGFRGRGRDHYRSFARIPGVKVAYLCDIDERLFPAAVQEV